MSKRFSIAALSAIGAIGLFTFAYAANPFAITFPIPELGSCTSVDECRAYCDKSENGEACAAFAESHGLASKKDVEQAKVLSAGGPGGCQGEEACRNYCEDAKHGEECLTFAEKHGFISKDDAKQSRKFLNQTGPGGCRGEACKTYCADVAHQEECIAFAEKSGLIGKADAKQAQEQRRQFQEEGGPGGCKSPQECRTYCDSGEHLDECLAFGVKRGYMKPEEAERIKKISGKGPGGCQGREQCEAYCHNQEHAEECLRFGEENGLIPKEDAERARKFLGKTGPGGCKGEACRTYCNNPEHAEECINFGVENGFIPKEEAERAKKFARAAQAGGPGGCKGEECRTYCSDPVHHDECFSFAKKQGLIRPEEQKQFEASQKIGEQIKTNGGPGGCKSEDECLKYCTSDPGHIEECAGFGAKFGGMSADEARGHLQEFKQNGGQFGPQGRFGPPQGGQQGFGGFGGQQGGPEQQFAGPGGCNSPQSCAEYCIDHRDECIAVFRKGQQPPPQAQDGPRTGPGGCQGFVACSSYCEDPSHQEECSRSGKPAEGQRNAPRPIGPPIEVDQDGRPTQKQFPFPGQGKGGEFAPPFGGMPRGRSGEGGFETGSFPKPPCNSPEECAALAKKFLESGNFPGGQEGLLEEKRGASDARKGFPGKSPGFEPGNKPGEDVRPAVFPRGGNPPCTSVEECAALRDKLKGQGFKDLLPGGMPLPRGDEEGDENNKFSPPPGDRPGMKPGEQFGGDRQSQGFDPSKMSPEQQKMFDQFGGQGGQPGMMPPGSQPGMMPGGGNFSPPPGMQPGAPPQGASILGTLRSLFAR